MGDKIRTFVTIQLVWVRLRGSEGGELGEHILSIYFDSKFCLKA